MTEQTTLDGFEPTHQPADPPAKLSLPKHITIDRLELGGFRAYLKPQPFKLRNKKGPLSLAIFAPNGKGKSSLVDSLEYYFSETGSLERLGQKSTANKAGIGAVRHVDAEKSEMETFVSMRFRQGNNTFEGKRRFSEPLTDQAKRVQEHVKAPFVIRGYELRRFVDDTSTAARYDDLVTWLDLSQLLAVQKNMADLKRRVKREANDDGEYKLRLRDLAGVTDNTVKTWDEHAVPEWLNTHVLAKLDASISFNILSDADPAFRELENRKHAESKRAGLETRENLLDTIDDLLGRAASMEDPAGLIHSFEESVSAFVDATADESAARSAASESVFGEVWASAKSLLEDAPELDRCPVCDTKFAKSPSVSRDGVYESLRLNLANLEGYRKAEEAKKRAKENLVRAAGELRESLDRIPLLAGSEYECGLVVAYGEALRSWTVGDGAPDSEGAVQTLASLRASVNADIERIGRQLDDPTYGSALEKVRSLLHLKEEFGRIRRTRDELQSISESLGRQTEAFNTAIVDHIRGLVDMLVDETATLYGTIQGPGAKTPRIKIELAKEGDAQQQSAKLLIDFAGREGVAPGGYLSDSQVHTLALSVRLAAIRLFNTGVRIIALDDIVTSYDADHRENIAAVLNDKFAEFQIILTTHDMSFFDALQGRLSENQWEFKRIEKIGPGFGPMFEDYRPTDEEIEEKIKKNEDVANEVRHAEEKWLYGICSEFRTKIDFGQKQHPGMYDMAHSLEAFLKDHELEPPKIPGHSKQFLQSMKDANIENRGSHYRNEPYASLSIGDEHARWGEFKRFRDMFKCPCGHRHFERQRSSKPACAKCGTPFSFVQKPPV